MTQVTTLVMPAAISLRQVWWYHRRRFQRNPQNDSPAQDTDVVGIHEGGYRVVHNAQNQVMKNLYDAAWRCQLVSGATWRDRKVGNRKDMATPTREAKNVPIT